VPVGRLPWGVAIMPGSPAPQAAPEDKKS
jgi:hypothetical protein